MPSDAVSLRMAADLEPAQHLCCLYETEEEHRALLTPFLRQGLQEGEKVLYFAYAHPVESVLGYLREEGLDPEPYLARGQLHVARTESVYLREGTFDPNRMIALLQAETEQALAEGYSALRVTGEMTWALGGLSGSDRLIEYEAKLNTFFPRSRCLTLCQYDRRRFPPGLLLGVLQTHPTAVVGTTLYHNLYYVPPEEFLGDDVLAATLCRCLKNLEEPRSSERDLAFRNRIADIFLTIPDQEMYGEVLQVLLRATKSKYGVFGYIDENGAYVVPSMTRDIWDQCQVPDKNIVFPPETWGESIWPRAIRQQKMLYSNEPSRLTPEGHICILRNITVPIVHRGEVVGLFQVANKETDYDGKDIQLAQTIADHIAPILNARLQRDREEKERKRAEEDVRRMNEELEQRVVERTAELALRNRIANIFLTVPEEEIYREVLQVLLQATNSKYGTFGYIDENGAYVVPSMTRDIWDQCQVPDKNIVFPRETWGESIWVRAIRQQKTLYSNEPSRLTPEGHIPIRRNIAVPLLHRGDVIGLFQVANKEQDYTEKDTQLAESIAAHIAPILSARLQRDREERARRQAEAERVRLFTAIEQAHDSVVITDTAGTIQYINPAFSRSTGYGVEEVLGKNPRILKSGQHGSSFYQNLWDTILAGEIWRGEIVNRRKDGSLYTEEMTITPVRLEGGGISHFIAIKADITERKQLETKLWQAQKMEAVGRLAGGVAHDFNNLLGVILGYSGLVLDGLSSTDPLHKKVEEIHKAAHRATSLTRQLLAFSRQQVLESKILNLNNVVADMEKMLSRLIGEDIELTTRLDPELGQVKADPGQLEQIILNLAVNARDAMPQGGRLTLETTNIQFDEDYLQLRAPVRPGPYVMLAMSDTGRGMDRQTQEHIFEPFFTTKEKGKGTGLGLATVYGIVKQSDGYIWVYSEPGQGTTFKIYLPRVGKAIAVAEPDKVSEETLRGWETVLLVEDSEPLRKLAREFLEMSGYTVLEASNGVDAIEVAEGHEGSIHLLMTDVVMPEMGGRALAERLVSERPEIRVLYMSGYTDNAIAHHGVLEQSTALLQKPFTRDALTHKVREALEAQESR